MSKVKVNLSLDADTAEQLRQAAKENHTTVSGLVTAWAWQTKADKRDYTIYAVDFDGTICQTDFPYVLSTNRALVEFLILRRERGDKVILWTCRVGETLEAAVWWCREQGLEFDAVNDNIPEMQEQWQANPRKVFADVYIDDMAVSDIGQLLAEEGK